MGIKTTLQISQLPSQYHNLSLRATVDGVCDSVYMLGDKYVLKYFENSDKERIKNEIKLLDNLKSLPVPRVVDKCYINNNITIIYSKIRGESIYNPSLDNIKDIAIFLKNFHILTQDISSDNINFFSPNRLLKKIKETNFTPLLNLYNRINIDLKNDGVIHGDLFVDNAKFLNNQLSGVYDFSDASIGDFRFDLAVVAISWCYDKDNINHQKIQTLLKYYKSELLFDEFKPYIQYALLYYATTRYINGRDYNGLIYRLEGLL